MNNHLLAGKTAIITGAGRGRGALLAKVIALAGANVCAVDINPDRAEHTAVSLTDSGKNAFGWQADVSNKFQAASMIETVRDRYGSLDILVHHAQVSPQTHFLEMDEWEWRRTLEVNLTGAFLTAQLTARVMVDEGGGKIIFVLKPPGEANHKDGTAALDATQAGIRSLATSIAFELADQNVQTLVLDTGLKDATIQRVLAFLSV